MNSTTPTMNPITNQINWRNFEASTIDKKELLKANFPPCGTHFRDRDEASALMKVITPLRENKVVEEEDTRRIIRKDGKPYQNWYCNANFCPGRMKVLYQSGHNQPGVVINSIPCSCPIRMNQAVDYMCYIQASSVQDVRKALIRYYFWEMDIPIIEFRASPVAGWSGNLDSNHGKPDSKSPAIKRRKLEEAKTTPDGRKLDTTKCIAKFVAKLWDGRWFSVSIRAVVGVIGTGDTVTYYEPVCSVNPIWAATKPTVVELLNEDKKLRAVEKKEVCQVCMTMPATNALCCTASASCSGGRLCTPCMFGLCFKRDQMDPFAAKVVVLNKKPFIRCLYMCEGSQVTQFSCLDDPDKSKVPLMFPMGWCFERPFRDVDDMDEHYAQAIVSDVKVHHNNARSLADRISFLQSRLQQWNDELTNLVPRHEFGSTDHDLKSLIDKDEAEMTKLTAERNQALSKIPAWARDWTMSIPIPRPAATFEETKQKAEASLILAGLTSSMDSEDTSGDRDDSDYEPEGNE